MSFKKKAHYAGGAGRTVQAGGLWGVIRAVTARITRCLGSGATSPVGGGMEEGTGNVWEVLDPCQELLGPLVSQGDLGLNRRDREPGGCQSYLSLQRGGAAYFWKCFMMARCPFQAFLTFLPQQGVGKGKPIVWNRGCR